MLTAMEARSPSLVYVEPFQHSVCAITSLDDEVFIVCDQTSAVYDAVTFVSKRNISLPALSNKPYGIAAFARNKCLYVSDFSTYKIYMVYRVELSGSNTLTTWSVGMTSGRPRSLSVNKAYNLVVACDGRNKLQEYTTQGSLVRETWLQAGVTDLCHAIQLSTGDYMVSQSTSPGVVSVVGEIGQVVHSYGLPQTSAVGQMKYPSSLAATKNDDILVADSGNNRIILFKRSTGCVQKLPLTVDGGIQHPHDLCLDESRGRLYVGEFLGQYRLLIFDGFKL